LIALRIDAERMLQQALVPGNVDVALRLYPAQAAQAVDLVSSAVPIAARPVWGTLTRSFPIEAGGQRLELTVTRVLR
jgi:hypothetical protein